MAVTVSPKDRWVEGLRIPLPSTMAKYGMNELDWRHFAAMQAYACGVCGKKPSTGILYTDHQHGVRGWRNMAPEKRKLYVRGLACYTCNRFVLSNTPTLRIARGLVAYLERYERRRPDFRRRPSE